MYNIEDSADLLLENLDGEDEDTDDDMLGEAEEGGADKKSSQGAWEVEEDIDEN